MRILQAAAVIVLLYLAVIVMFDEVGLVVIAIHLGLTGVSFLRLPRPIPRAESSSPPKHRGQP
jgi:hypothetical protein